MTFAFKFNNEEEQNKLDAIPPGNHIPCEAAAAAVTISYLRVLSFRYHLHARLRLTQNV